MTRQGLDRIVTTLQQLHSDHPELFTPISNVFGIDIHDRLHNPVHQKNLWYGYAV
jgi:4-hydroxy-tetrahydrodipicolinate synthase